MRHDELSSDQWVLPQVLEKQAEIIGSKPYLQMIDGDSVSYAQVNKNANRLSWGLRNIGVNFGSKVGVMLPNCLEYCYSWLAITKIGAIHVAINTNNRKDSLSHVFFDSGIEVLLCDRSYLPQLNEIPDAVKKLKKIVIFGNSSADFANDQIDCVHYETILSDDETNPGVEIQSSDISTIMYTSGTTGPSKGVLMPHGHTFLLGLGIVDNLNLNSEDCYYITMPLFHANGLFMQLFSSLIVGCKAVIAEKFSASNWSQHLREYGITVTNTLGVMTEFLLRQPIDSRDQENPLHTVLAVPTPASLAPQFKERFGIVHLLEGYGMTEVNMPLYLNSSIPWRGNSCGKPYSRYFEVMIADPKTDLPVAPYKRGEILVRGKVPFGFCSGYLNLPEKNVAAFRNFWFHTGDAGYFDEDGYFYFVDRIKDCMRVRGENVSSFEIESVLRKHPMVQNVAAVAAKSEMIAGEDEIRVFVIPQSGVELQPQDIISYAEENLPKFAVPRYVELVKEFPRTPTEKIQKFVLRDRALSQKTWDRRVGKYIS